MFMFSVSFTNRFYIGPLFMIDSQLCSLWMIGHFKSLVFSGKRGLTRVPYVGLLTELSLFEGF